MLLSALDRRIRKSFSDAAMQYDILTSLHKEIGRELSRKVIDSDHVDRILDVGMGTGWLTNRLSFFLPESQIIGLDFAPGMVTLAKKKWEDITVVQANGCRLPFKEASFDILISNLAYQWIGDIEAALIGNHAVLNSHGKIYVTLFGFNTFKELFESLEQTQQQEKSDHLGISRLRKMDDIKVIASQSGFKNVKCDYETIKVHFPDMFSLVKWIKNIGANVLRTENFVGKQWLSRANQYYAQNYKDKFGVSATFEVIWLEASKSVYVLDL